MIFTGCIIVQMLSFLWVKLDSPPTLSFTLLGETLKLMITVFVTIFQIRWHDLAFFDPGVYESLRKMILDSRKPDGAECLATLGLTFAVNLRPEEGGETFELIPDGGTVCVTPSNVLEYVKKYAMLRMVKVNSEPLSVSVMYIFAWGVEGIYP